MTRQGSVNLSFRNLDIIVQDSGNLTPPVNVYSTSVADIIITISGLPLGIFAILINLLLIISIIKNGTFTPATYILYFHIALCDMINGAIGIVTSTFMLQNMRSPIDPEWAQTFCKYFAPMPTCIIRILLYLMATMALFRAYIVFRPSFLVSKFGVNLFIIFSYIIAVALLVWFPQTSAEVIALPDGWCVYYTSHYTLTDTLYAVIIDSGPVILCFLVVILSLALVCYRVSTATTHIEENSQVFILQNQGSQIQVVKSIINQIVITFLVCYSAALYIEMRQIIMALGGNRYDFVTFPDPDGPPHLPESRLIIFRLKFSLTIIFSIVNPLLVFRGSHIFRQNIGTLFNDDFSYVLSRN